MNHVFLSGLVESAPQMVSRQNEIPHAVMNLTVRHLSAKGVEKSEQYPLSAWRGIATRMVELIKPGAHLCIKGYLSQKQRNDGIFIEITVEEFNVSSRNTAIRHLRSVNSVRLEAPTNHPILSMKDNENASYTSDASIS